MKRRELVKMVVQAVVLEREDGKILGEEESQRVACYNPEQLAALWAQVEVEVADWNAQQPNRSQRRRSK